MSETPPPEPAPEPEPQPAPPARPPARPVLRRSRDDRVIAGVCGGLGRYFGIDPLILRIAFVVLLLAGGAGILLYLVAWIAVPEERTGDHLGEPAERALGGHGGPELVGIALVVLGAFFLFREAFPDVFDSDYVWPTVLIVLGLVVLARGVRR